MPKMPKMVNFGSFWKPEATYETGLPDWCILIGPKLVENAKIKNLKYDVFGDFQTLWTNMHKNQFWHLKSLQPRNRLTIYKKHSGFFVLVLVLIDAPKNTLFIILASKIRWHWPIIFDAKRWSTHGQIFVKPQSLMVYNWMR